MCADLKDYVETALNLKPIQPVEEVSQSVIEDNIDF